MRRPTFEEAIAEIVRTETRYAPEAYLFVREGLDYTIKMLKQKEAGAPRHVRGTELLEGLRRLALDQFGPLAYRVLAHWGLRSTEDFGAIVFRLVDYGALGKTDEDTEADFAQGYDFETAFRHPFLSRAARTTAPATPQPESTPDQ
ncbi:MAG: hypothetical protein K9N49_03805 [Candidatus Marinimicrobia bacterium]|nr:hypothetical protein [Candidatus Neomarinimicrobiota bacterium]